MDASEIELVRSSFSQGLTGVGPASLVAALDALGFADLFEAEPATAVGELFDALGRLLTQGPALDIVVVSALGVNIKADTALVHPHPRTLTTASSRVSEAGALRVHGLVMAGHAAGSALVVPAMTDNGVHAFAVAADTATITWRAVRGADPDAGWQVIDGKVPAPALDDLGPADDIAGAAAARRAVGHELVGVGSAMLSIGVEHVKNRHQFGKPIGTFQSVRHRLADVHAALTAARNLLAGSWNEPDPMMSDVAKAQAGRAALLAAQHVQQVCGAMGYTWEHSLHRYIRRALMLDSFYGRASALTVAVGRQMLDSASVPRFNPIHLAEAT